jgi:hypothetical protein
MYTVEKDGEFWLILKAGIERITVKSEPLASAIAAMLNAFAQAGAERCEAGHCAESPLLLPSVAQGKAKGAGEGT